MMIRFTYYIVFITALSFSLSNPSHGAAKTSILTNDASVQPKSNQGAEYLLRKARKHQRIHVWVYYKKHGVPDRPKNVDEEILLTLLEDRSVEKILLRNDPEYLLDLVKERGRIRIWIYYQNESYSVQSVDENTLRQLIEDPFVKRMRRVQSLRTH